MAIDESTLVESAARLGRRLVTLNGLVVTVESCTGGLIARLLTETAGSSAWFDRGFVTYSNESKVDLVGVRIASLDEHGAVSEVVAGQMALGGLKHSQAVLSLAVTGIAGPGGAVAGKPVGTVCFGWALALPQDGRQDRVVVETCRFDGDRAEVRLLTARHALARGLALLDAGSGATPGGHQPKD